MKIYNKYSDSLKYRYGEKVYKVPINIKGTCPNRINNETKRCSFCDINGADYDMIDNNVSVKNQFIQNRDYISKKYNAKKFIVYFQNYTGTYLMEKDFINNISDVLEFDNIVQLCISTRPDSITDLQLDFLKKVSKENNIDICIELGLQSINHNTLNLINRDHTLAEYLYMMNKLKSYNFLRCTHLILNLPYDGLNDIIEASKIMSALKTEYVKIHSLHIPKESSFGHDYDKIKNMICTKDEYIDRVITFLEYLDPNIVVQRLLSRMPEGKSLFCNWSTSWRKIYDDIIEKMENEKRYQGRLFNYLNPKILTSRS